MCEAPFFVASSSMPGEATQDVADSQQVPVPHAVRGVVAAAAAAQVLGEADQQVKTAFNNTTTVFLVLKDAWL